jgi:hypothetical protein
LFILKLNKERRNAATERFVGLASAHRTRQAVALYPRDASMRLEEVTAILEGLLETATTPAERADLRRVLELLDS